VNRLHRFWGKTASSTVPARPDPVSPRWVVSPPGAVTPCGPGASQLADRRSSGSASICGTRGETLARLPRATWPTSCRRVVALPCLICAERFGGSCHLGPGKAHVASQLRCRPGGHRLFRARRQTGIGIRWTVRSSRTFLLIRSPPLGVSPDRHQSHFGCSPYSRPSPSLLPSTAV